MPEVDVANLVKSNITGTIVDYSVESEVTDGADGTKEFRWQMEHWEKYLGYYKQIPELQTAIDAKANWTIGAGFTSDEVSQMILGSLQGHGKDSFNTILGNMIRTYTIGGDSFAEIIRNQDDLIINLKPLDPNSIVIVSNAQGIIIRYEQVSKTKKPNKRFNADDIFHLSRKRIADEVHGISVVSAVEFIILARNEAMTDWKRVLHRNIDPLWVIHLDTDDTAKINTIKTTWDSARVEGENIYVPKDVVVPELITTAANASLNPLAWISQLADYFFQAVNVPQIIVGNAKEFTDASGKIVYLAFEQSVKGEQLYIEEQILNQLNVDIQLTFPASLQNDLISDDKKESDLQASQPSDTTAELEGPT